MLSRQAARQAGAYRNVHTAVGNMPLLANGDVTWEVPCSSQPRMQATKRRTGRQHRAAATATACLKSTETEKEMPHHTWSAPQPPADQVRQGPCRTAKVADGGGLRAQARAATAGGFSWRAATAAGCCA